MSKLFFLSNIFQKNIGNTKNIFQTKHYEVGYDVIANKMKINNPPNNIMRINIYFINADLC